MAATASTDLPPRGWLGPDPGRSIRIWTALLLRLGIGLSLLSSGLAGYFGQSAGAWGTNPFGRGPSFSMVDPFLSALPYAAISLGLALILGFLTTAAAIGAGFFGLILPILTIFQMVVARATGGPNPAGGPWGNNFFFEMTMAMTLPNLLTHAAMIWLSPLENNPYSVDAMIFGRNEIEPMPAPIPEIPAAEMPTIHIGD